MSGQPTLGVVIAVYAGVDPRHLERSLEGLEQQTRPAEVVWVVKDGELTDGLERVLQDFLGRLPVTVLSTTQRLGAGPARQRALDAAETELIAIADADDISVAHRFEAQVAALEERSLDLLGSAMTEFGSAARSGQLRTAPLDEATIRRRARMNNPFNHPTLMFRASLARAAGGYRDVPLLEDYDMVIRMLAKGAKVENLREPLVNYRLDDMTLRRRSGRGVSAAEWRLQSTLVELGMISRPRAALNLMVRNGYRAMPIRIRRWTHEHVLSSPDGGLLL